jgi:hypothetical protein
MTWLTLAQGREDRGRIIYTRPGDSDPGVVEVYWSPDSRYFAVLLGDQITSPMLLAYDTLTRTKIDEGVFRAKIGGVIMHRYALSEEQLRACHGDPLSWACSPFWGAPEQFQEMIGADRVLKPIPTDRASTVLSTTKVGVSNDGCRVPGIVIPAQP